MILRILTIFAVMAGSCKAAEPVIQSPNTSINYAAYDLLAIKLAYDKVSQDSYAFTSHIRYLSLYHLQNNEEEKKALAKSVSFAIHSLSKRKDPSIPVFVSGSQNTLIRVNLDDYEIDPKQWDNLGKTGSGPKPRFEPYFHAKAQKTNLVSVEPVYDEVDQVENVLLGNDINGRPVYQQKTVRKRIVKEAGKTDKKVEEVLLPAPWLDPVAVDQLYKMTGSDFPVLRADWFVTYSTLEPAYHLLLGFGEDEKSFADLIGADEAKSSKFRAQDKGVVVKSKVALNNRTLIRSPAQKGYYWVSHDSLKSTDDRNYAQNFLDEKFDATEIIASLPNGLQAYFIGDAKGKRLDKADNEIAKDYEHSDGIVRSGRSCITCHATGLQSIEDEVRIMSQFSPNASSKLITVDDKKYREIRDLFGSNLEKQVVADRQIYADAIGLVTGWTPAENARQYKRFWEGYVEDLLTREQIANECGIMLSELDKYARNSSDNSILGTLKKPIRPVRRDQWELSFQSLMIEILKAKSEGKK